MRRPLLLVAFRNVLRHAKRTLLIGALVLATVVVAALGRDLLFQAEAAIQESYQSTFTGDVVLSAWDLPVPSLSPEAATTAETPPIVPDYEAWRTYLAGHPDVASVSPQLMASFTIELAEGRSIRLPFVGTLPSQYREVFPSGPASGVAAFDDDAVGVVVTQALLRALSMGSQTEVGVGDEIRVSYTSPTGGTRIRLLPILGTTDTGGVTGRATSFMDALSFQILLGLDSADGSAVQAPEGAFASTENLDGFFSDNLLSDADVEGAAVSVIGSGALVRAASGPSEPLDRYHFLVVRLNEGASDRRVVRDLTRHAEDIDSPVMVSEWTVHAGTIGTLVVSVQSVFTVLVVVVAVVAFLVILNTVLLSVSETTKEIGTMRALGFRRGWIVRLVMAETSLVAVPFGIAGLFFAAALRGVLAGALVARGNVFFTLLFGRAASGGFAWGAGAVVVLLGTAVAVAASLYPAARAAGVNPVVAMQPTH